MSLTFGLTAMRLRPRSKVQSAAPPKMTTASTRSRSFGLSNPATVCKKPGRRRKPHAPFRGRAPRRCPGTECHVKQATVVFNRMGDMGKLPTSAWLRLSKAGGIRKVLDDICGEETSPTRRDEPRCSSSASPESTASDASSRRYSRARYQRPLCLQGSRRGFPA